MKLYQKLLVILLTLGVLFSDASVEHFQNAKNPNLFNDDVRQWIPPFYQYQSNGPQGDDYISNYYLQVLSPLGYRTIYTLVAKFWDPNSFSKLLPYLEWFLLVTALGFVAWKLGGSITCFCTLALILSTPVFFDRMIGGLPRSFGYPLLSIALAAVIFDRVYFLAAITLLGAAFYPVVSVISGFWLTLLLLGTPARLQRETAAWSLRKRITIIMCTTILSVTLVLPQALASLEYGDKVRGSDIKLFPEAGAGGRYGDGDRPPFNNFLEESIIMATRTLLGSGNQFIERISLRSTKDDNGFSSALNFAIVVATTMVVWGLKLAFARPTAYRLLLAFLGVLLAHSLALLTFPYLYMPSRYITLTIPLFIVTMFPGTLFSMMKSVHFIKNKRGCISIVVFSIVTVIIVLVGGKGDGNTGYTVRTSGNNNLYSFIRKLPADSMIAGWPFGVMDNVFYQTKRKTFLTFETHQVLHKKYAYEMRKRITALMEAYFALDSKALQTLRDRYGVRYLLVEKDMVLGENNIIGFDLSYFKYFRPFHQMALLRFNQLRGKEFIFSLKLNEVAVFREDPWVLIDLTKIG